MVAGRLQEKNGFYYMVLSYTDANGKRKQPWVSTGLPVKGNKKRAEEMLSELRQSFAPPKVVKTGELSPNMLFSDYMLHWLKIIRSAVQETTWSSYCFNVKDHIVPYFEATEITLGELRASHIQSFYLHELETLKATSVLRFHANLHKALKYAVKLDLIPGNPVDKVERPKKNVFHGNFYSEEEMLTLFDAVSGDPLELCVKIAAYYGFRRSEVLGLRWDAIDFERKTISISHKVIEAEVDGKFIPVGEDVLKTKSSFRTLPLIPAVEKLLLEEKEKQEMFRRLFKKSYCRDYLDYICVDQCGKLLRPNYVTEHFAWLIEKYDLKKIRFHDLRHTCASLLLSSGISMKQIQIWLGHSTFATTADIYAHLDFTAQEESANAMSGMFSREPKEVQPA